MKEGEVNHKEKSVTSFPVESLAGSLELIGKIIESRGEQPSTLKEVALITGIGEGTLPLPLSTACQYGVLESTFGSGYRPTPLYHRIQSPTFEHDKQLAIFEALGNPPLYKKIIEEFNGKTLPSEKGFANYLTTKYGFKAYAIPRIVRSFFENFKDSIDSNNKLRYIAPSKSGKATAPARTGDDTVQIVSDVRDLTEYSKQSQGNFKQPIPLPNGKMIILEYPKGSMSEDDFKALRAFIDFLSLTEGINK